MTKPLPSAQSNDSMKIPFNATSPAISSQAQAAVLLPEESPIPLYDPLNAAKPGLFVDSDLNYRVVDAPDISDYTVAYTPGLLDIRNKTLALHLCAAKRTFLILDPAVDKLYGEQISAYLQQYKIDYILFPLESKPNNEDNKSAEVWATLLAKIMRFRPAGDDLILAIGGGVTHDLIGFLVSTLRRGSMRYLMVPTTLTAMVDAGISPKTGVNIGFYKNAAGTVYPPIAVLVDPAFLRTVDYRDLLTGMAEILKIATMRSAALFDYLEASGIQLLNDRFQGPYGLFIINSAIRLFLRMKWEPPFPGNKPASLRSFGHSFSKELESLSEFTLLHGEAVAVEMAVAANLSSQLAILPCDDRDRILRVLSLVGLPIYHHECEVDAIWAVFAGRYEAGRKFYFAMPYKIGQGMFLSRFTKEQLAKAIREACDLGGAPSGKAA